MLNFQGVNLRQLKSHLFNNGRDGISSRLRTPEELVRDKGRRVHDLSYEGLTHILWVGEPLLVGSCSDDLG